MNYKDFSAEVKQSVQEKVGKGYEVIIRQVSKNNGVMLDGLSIGRRQDTFAPVVYLQPYYEQLGSNMTFDEIVKDILSIYKMYMGISMRNTAEALTVFDYVKDKVVFKLIQAETNRELLAEIPSIPFLDMAIVFYLLLDKSEEGQMTALIYNNHLEVWNTTVEGLYQLAKINTPKLLPARLRTMEEVMFEIPIGQFTEIEEGDVISGVSEEIQGKPALYVFTNQNGVNGAACILYEGYLEEFAKKKGTDILILPSSIHEVLLITDNGILNYGDLEDMVKHTNKNDVPVEDVLSDRIYRYSLAERKISIVAV